MGDTSVKEIARKLSSAFHLKTRPLAVFGTDQRPENAVHLSEIHRCLAFSMYRMAALGSPDAFFISGDNTEGCCPGGLSHTGFTKRPDYIRFFVSTGRKDVRGGAAEYLKASPDLVDRSFKALGTITIPGKYLVVQGCETLPEPEPAIRSICCFGNAEQVRNLAALVHFDREDPFSPVIVPWGPSCSTFITYPARLAEHAPRDAAFMGPQDPTQNYSLPPDTMALGIPVEVAQAMARNLDDSFVIKRPKVAFPGH